MPSLTHDLPETIADVGGKTLAGLLAPLGPLRHAKPLHPEGTVRHARLEVTDPAPALMAPAFAERSEHLCLARTSRAVGLPESWPDIGGLAVRLAPQASPGSRGDLLFATTGQGRWSRWLLVPRRDPSQGVMTTLLPLASAAGPVLFRAAPTGPSAYRISWARPRGPWQPLARLVLDEPLQPDADPPVRFDPVLDPVPGLPNYSWVRRLREPAYAGARRLWPRQAGTAAPTLNA